MKVNFESAKYLITRSPFGRRIIATALVTCMLGTHYLGSANAVETEGVNESTAATQSNADYSSGNSGSGSTKLSQVRNVSDGMIALSGSITFIGDGKQQPFEPALVLCVNGEPYDEGKVYISKSACATGSDAVEIPIYNDLDGGSYDYQDSDIISWSYLTSDLPEFDDNGDVCTYSITVHNNRLATNGNAAANWELFYADADGNVLGGREAWTPDATNLIYVQRGEITGTYRSDVEIVQAEPVRLELGVENKTDEAFMSLAEGRIQTGAGTWTISNALLYNPVTGEPIVWRARVAAAAEQEAFTFVYENTGKYHGDGEYVYAGGSIVRIGSTTFKAEGTVVWADGDNWHGMRPLDDTFMTVADKNGTGVTAQVSIKISQQDALWSYQIAGLTVGETYTVSQNLPNYQAETAIIEAGAAGQTVKVNEIREKLITTGYSGIIRWDTDEELPGEITEELGLLRIFRDDADVTEHLGFDVIKGDHSGIWYYTVDGLIQSCEYNLKVHAPEGYESNLTGYMIKPANGMDRFAVNMLPEIRLNRSTFPEFSINNDTQGETVTSLDYTIKINDAAYTGSYVLLDEAGEVIDGSTASGPDIRIKAGTTVKIRLLNAAAMDFAAVEQHGLEQAGIMNLKTEQNGNAFVFRNTIMKSEQACAVWTDNNNYDGMRPFSNEDDYLAAGHLKLYVSLDGIEYELADNVWPTLGFGSSPQIEKLTNKTAAASDWYFTVDNLPRYYWDENSGEWIELQYKIGVEPGTSAAGYGISEAIYMKDPEAVRTDSWKTVYTKLKTFKAGLQWYDDNLSNTVRPDDSLNWEHIIKIYQANNDDYENGVLLDDASSVEITVTDMKDISISGLPEYDEKGWLYTYYITVEDIPVADKSSLINKDVTPSYVSQYENTGNITAKADGCYENGIIKVILQGTLDFSLIKEWSDGNPKDPAAVRPDVTVTLWRYTKAASGTYERSYLAAAKVDTEQALFIDKTQSRFELNISGLPAFDEDGNEYIYFIKETMDGAAGDYAAEINNAGTGFEEEAGANQVIFNRGSIVNKLTGTKTITGSKVWKAKTVQSMKAGIVVGLQRRIAGSNNLWVTVDEKQVTGFRAEVTSQSFAFVTAKYDSDGCQYEYRVVEKEVTIEYPGMEPETAVLPESSYDKDTYRYQVGEYTYERTIQNGVIVNQLVGETAIEIDKYWNQYDGTQELHFHIYRNNSPKCVCEELIQEIGGSLKPDGNGGHLGYLIMTPGDEADTEDGVTHWKYILKEIPKYDSEGAEYLYTITEDIPDGYHSELNINYGISKDADYNHLMVQVFNDNVGDSPSVKVIKQWLDDSDLLHREPVTVELFKDGKATGKTMTLTANKGWQGYFKLDDREYDRYSVKERLVGNSVRQPGTAETLPYFNTDEHIYEVVSEEHNDSFTEWTITNRRVGVIHIDLTKTWIAGDNADGYTATFEVLQNGSLMTPRQTITLTAEAGGKAAGKLENLPKYDENGVVYQYSLKETEVKDPNAKHPEEEIKVTNNLFYMNGILYKSEIRGSITWGETQHTNDIYSYRVTNRRIGTKDIVFHIIWKDDNHKASRPDIYLKLYQWLDVNGDGKPDEVNDKDKTSNVKLVEMLPVWEHDGDYHDVITYKGLPEFDKDTGYYYGYYAEEGMQAPGNGGWVKAYYDQLPKDLQPDKYSYLISLDDSNNGDSMPENGIVVNYREGSAYVHGRKIWENMGLLKKGDYPEIVMALQASYRDPQTGVYSAPQPVTGEGGKPRTVTLGAVDGVYQGTYEFADLPKFDKITGAKILYTVTESFISANAESYKREDKHYGFKNTYQADQSLSIEITKNWDLQREDDSNGYPVIEFELWRVIQKYYDDEQPSDLAYTAETAGIPAVLDKNAGQNSVNFDDLPYYAPNGRPYRYYVKERLKGGSDYQIPGYLTDDEWNVVLSEADGRGKVTGTCEIINQYSKETVTIKGTKQWVGDTQEWSSGEYTDTFRPTDKNAVNLTLWRKTASLAEEQLSGINDDDGIPADNAAVFHWGDEASTGSLWSYTFTEHPAKPFYRYATNGEEYTYFVKETSAVPGYTATGGAGGTGTVSDNQICWEIDPVKNRLQTVRLSVNKYWDDSENMYHTRPAAVTVKLQRKLKNDNSYADVYKDGQLYTLTLKETDWSGWFSSLPKYKITWKGAAATFEEYHYRAIEVTIPDDYYDPEGLDNPYADPNDVNHDRWGYVVTSYLDVFRVTFVNILKAEETVSVTAEKVWKDAYNQDGFRREVTFGLFRDEMPEPIHTVTLNGQIESGEGPGVNGREDTPWHVTWKNQPKWIGGNPDNGLSVYTVKEIERVAFYEKPVGTMTQIKDQHNPDIITGYHFTIENKHDPIKDISVTFEKKWQDNDNWWKTRPESIIVELWRTSTGIHEPAVNSNGVLQTAKVSPTKDGSDNEVWKATFDNLPYAREKTAAQAGKDYVYTYYIKELAVPGYDSGNSTFYTPELAEDISIIGETGKPAYYGNTGTVSITNTMETVDVLAAKTWEDSSDAYSTRPDKITFALFRAAGSNDYEQVDSKLAPPQEILKEDGFASPEGRIELSYKGLPKNNAENKPYQYQIREIALTFDDVTYPVDWSRYDSGADSSVKAGGYEIRLSEDGKTITNSLITDGSIKVTKIWDDCNNQDGIRGTVTIGLYQTTNQESDMNDLSPMKTIVLSNTAVPKWSYEWSKLPRQTPDGDRYYYAIKEINVNSYESTLTEEYSGWFLPEGKTVEIEVTNKYTPKTMKIEVIKVWEGDHVDFRPEEIIFTLEEQIEGTDTWSKVPDSAADNPKSVKSNPDGTFSPVVWENLPVHKQTDTEHLNADIADETSKRISYRVVESSVPGYQSVCQPVKVNGSLDSAANQEANAQTITVTNTLKTTSLTIQKSWDDLNNIYGRRPEEITVRLQHTTDPKQGTWTDFDDPIVININQDETIHRISELPVANETGENLYYRAVEVKIGDTKVNNGKALGYTVNYDRNNIPASGNGKGIVKIINTFETINLSGTKKWDDQNDRYKLRPEAIKLIFNADGKVMESQPEVLWKQRETVWDWSVKDLPKEDAYGRPITYTAAEEDVPGYNGSQIQLDFENQLRTGSLAVTKSRIGGSGKAGFTFRVDLTINGTTTRYTGEYKVINTDDEITADGEARQTGKNGGITILSGQKFVITGLPEGTVYKVTEDAKSNYYLNSVTGDTGVIPYQSTAEAAFVNRYHSNSEDGDKDPTKPVRPTTEPTTGPATEPTSPSAQTDPTSVPKPSVPYETDPNRPGIIVPPGDIIIQTPDGEIIWEGKTPSGYIDTDLPAGQYQITVIDDNGIPLVYMLDVPAPLTGLARTGDTGATIWMLSAIMAAAAAGFGIILYRKKRADEET